MYYSQVQHSHRVRHFLSMSVSSLVGIAGGLIVLLLAGRFVLSFIQISDLPTFTANIYNFSYPFVAPVTRVFGEIAVQYQTLIAIVFWALAAWLLARLTSLTDPTQ